MGRATSSQQVAARSSVSLYVCYCRSATPQYGETQISLTAALVVSLVRSGRGLLLIKNRTEPGVRGKLDPVDDNEKRDPNTSRHFCYHHSRGYYATTRGTVTDYRRN